MFLRASDHFCEIKFQGQDFGEVIDLCQRILTYDDCWERAYRHLMIAYDQLGDHGQVARTYQRCVDTLQKELDVSPADETETFYKRLTSKSSS